MPISMADLPEKYRKQVFDKYVQQARRTPPPSAKYGNQKSERILDGAVVMRFDSKKEAERYDYLHRLLRAGKISDLRMQVDFTLQEAYTDTSGERVMAIRYRADFTYIQNGVRIVEDVKGHKTKEYIIKRKIMKAKYGITIREV